jgi:hypothetical protein
MFFIMCLNCTSNHIVITVSRIGYLTDQNNKRIVLALQSGLKSEILWALNALTVLSFKEKDDQRRDTTPLAKVPGLLDALLQVVCLPFYFPV